jgi:hypothetical protein
VINSLFITAFQAALQEFGIQNNLKPQSTQVDTFVDTGFNPEYSSHCLSQCRAHDEFGPIDAYI